MKDFLHLNKRTVAAVVTIVAIVIATALFLSGRGQSTSANTQPGSSSASKSSQADPAVDLSPSQLNSIKIESVGSYQFPIEKETVGTISFADDLTIDVFPAGTKKNAPPVFSPSRFSASRRCMVAGRRKSSVVEADSPWR